LRLTRTWRLRLGCAVALLYLLCVMTPTVALALPGSAIPDCLMLDEAGVPHTHMHGAGGMTHHAMNHVAAPRHEIASNDLSVAPDEKSQPGHTQPGHTQPGHAAGSSCCELMCLSALPAAFAEIMPPIQPLSLRIREATSVMADNAPPRLYRPPIS
jgi:hypothetical protein